MTEDQKTETRTKGQLTGPEKVFLPVVVVVAIGWIMQIDKEGSSFVGLEAWFLMLSLGAAVVIGILIGLKYFGRLVPPARIHRLILSIACLLPLIGFLAAQLDGIGKTLTVWGSLAITYVGVTSLWRNRFPRIFHDPFRLGSAKKNDETREAAAAMPETVPPDANETQEPAPTSSSSAPHHGAPEARVDGLPDDGGGRTM